MVDSNDSNDDDLSINDVYSKTSSKLDKLKTSVLEAPPKNTYTATKAELVDGLNECSNAEYHADRKYLSSSVLKTVLESLDKYHNDYILGNKTEYSTATQSNFDVGSLIHSMILEPETVASGYNYYKGFRKAGAEYDSFLATCSNKALPIISVNQLKQASELLEAFNKLGAAKNLIRNGAAEQTICGNIAGVPIKTRFDWINAEEGYIADVKSTGYSSDKESFTSTIESFKYDLSGALYTMMAESYYGKPFDFYYIVVSKKDKTCDVYKTSKKRMLDGRKKVIQACEKYLRAKETNVWREVSNEDTIISTATLNTTPYIIEEI